MIGSTILVALTTLLASPGTESLVWQKDYATALQKGKETGKPLAVILGKGANGWQSISKDGKLDSQTTDVLSQKYVCLYVDISEESGKQVADSFKLKDAAGLVISSPGGSVQAFRHDGVLPQAEIQQKLERYADPKVVVTTTEGDPIERTSLYPPTYSQPGQIGWSVPGYCPSCQRGGR